MGKTAKSQATAEETKTARTKLTAKQQLFVAVYLATLNATEAARRAYDVRDDDASAASIGYENLRKPQIRTAIDAAFQERVMRETEVLVRLGEQASSSMEDFVAITEETAADGSATASAQLDLIRARNRGKLHLIKELTEERRQLEDGTKEVKLTVKLYDSQAALRDLGRYHKLFTDKQEIKAEVDVRVEDARDKLARLLADRARRERARRDSQETES